MRFDLGITGIGAASPYGIGGEVLWRGLMAGRPRFEVVPAPGHRCGMTRVARTGDPIGQVGDAGRVFRLLPRCTQLSLLASRDAWRDAALPDGTAQPERVGLYVASTYGLLDELEQFEADLERLGLAAAKPSVYQELTLGALAGHLSMQHRTRGPVVPLAGGWSSGFTALHLAALALESQEVDVALVAAVESFGPGMHRESCERGWLAPAVDDGSGPGGAGASGGLVQSEGAVMLVLERLGSALGGGRRVYCEIAGIGGANAGGTPFMDQDGSGVTRSMREALGGEVALEDVDALFSHACGHPVIDGAEARAIAAAYPAGKVTISSVTSALGHCGSAAGLFNLAAAAMSLFHARALPCGGLDGDPRSRNGVKPRAASAALVNTFSQYGEYGSVLLRATRADHADHGAVA